MNFGPDGATWLQGWEEIHQVAVALEASKPCHRHRELNRWPSASFCQTFQRWQKSDNCRRVVKPRGLGIAG